MGSTTTAITRSIEADDATHDPAPPRAVRWLLELHADRRGQILPLIFFLGVAFFSTVLLVVNSGRTVNFRIENQNATDAAVVSGATSMARGMNYLASNNLAQARLLSVVIVLRAVPKATEIGLRVLDFWEMVVYPAMKSAASAMKAAPFPPVVAAGVALDIAAEILKIKIKLERIILKAIKKVIGDNFGWFDKGIKDQTEANLRSKPKGAAWTILRGLTLMGSAIAWWGPIVSQYTAQVVYRKNLSRAGGFGFGLLFPVYPGMPVCKPGFGAFQPPLADGPWKFVSELATPIVIVGWAVLTLSFWALPFQIGVVYHTKRLFKGDVDEDEENDCKSIKYFEDAEIVILSRDNCDDAAPSWVPKDKPEGWNTDRCRGECRKLWIKAKADLLKKKQKEKQKKEVKRAQIGANGPMVIGGKTILADVFPYRGELKYWEKTLEEAKKAKEGKTKPGDSTWTDGDRQDRQDDLDQHGKKIDQDPDAGGNPLAPDEDPVAAAQKEVDRLKTEIKKWTKDHVQWWRIKQERGEVAFWREKAVEAERRLDAIPKEIADLRRQKAGKSALEQAAIDAQIADLEAEVTDHEKTITKVEGKLTNSGLQGSKGLILQDWELKAEISVLKSQIDKLKKHIEDLAKRSTEKPKGDPPPVEVEKGDTKKAHPLDKKYYPFLLEAKDWPISFTVHMVAARSNRPPLGSSDNFFGVYGEAFGNKMPLGFTYAAARVISPKAADLWTSNWRAKLVRVDPSHWKKPDDWNDVTRFPLKCDDYPDAADEKGARQTQLTEKSDAVTENKSKGASSKESKDSMWTAISKVLKFFSKH